VKDDDRLELNKAARRRITFFGVSPESAFVLFGVLTFCALLAYLGLPKNIAIAIFVVSTLASAFLVKDGVGEIAARLRNPVEYTRGFWKYRSPFKKQQQKRKRR
jgi:hypothetical protein